MSELHQSTLLQITNLQNRKSEWLVISLQNVSKNFKLQVKDKERQAGDIKERRLKQWRKNLL